MAELKRVTNRGDNFNELKYYTFDKNKPPILEVELEEKFVAEIEDGLGGILREDQNKLFPRDFKPYTERVLPDPIVIW